MTRTIPTAARSLVAPAKAAQTPYIERSLSVSPWDIEKPPTAYDLWSQTPRALVLPAAAGSTVVTTAATGGLYMLPAENVAVLKSVVFTIETPAVGDAWVVSVLQNGAPIPGLAQIGFPPVGAAYFALPINGTFAVTVPGAQISVRWESLGMTAPRNVGVVLSGWFLPPQDIMLWTGQRPGQIVGDPAVARQHLAR